jgi:predicted secreted protein
MSVTKTEEDSDGRWPEALAGLDDWTEENSTESSKPTNQQHIRRSMRRRGETRLLH